MRERCYCGADDCGECHPELHVLEECPCCHDKHWLYESDMWDSNPDGVAVCVDCKDYIECEDCGEWYNPKEFNKCPFCKED